MKKILLIPFCLILASCITTKVRDFTDPDYTNYAVKKILIDAPTLFFYESFSSNLQNIDVQHATIESLFLPTRTYTESEKIEIIRNNGFDSLLAIEVANEDQSSTIIGYNTNSYANAYSTGYNSTYASGSSTTTPIVSHNRSTQAQAKLYDLKTGRIIWIGNLNTKASGALYMSSGATINSMTRKIVTSLINSGHLTKIEIKK
ncbi:hypothetical protein [Thalassolituus sp. UBA2009]|uniref:hypothetical protein n=1 Tax=Thalassolituus sp. UBA2009 TaxID=1947658 RepID=UPI0025797278|nr:hypothetical protein [Thalassolituus sp. UBA2009]